MKHFKHTNMKRTLCFSTSPALAGLFYGRISHRIHKNLKQVVKTYVDEDGRKRWQGTAALKQTQTLEYILVSETPTPERYGTPMEP